MTFRGGDSHWPDTIHCEDVRAVIATASTRDCRALTCRSKDCAGNGWSPSPAILPSGPEDAPASDFQGTARFYHGLYRFNKAGDSQVCPGFRVACAWNESTKCVAVPACGSKLDISTACSCRQKVMMAVPTPPKYGNNRSARRRRRTVPYKSSMLIDIGRTIDMRRLLRSIRQRLTGPYVRSSRAHGPRCWANCSLTCWLASRTKLCLQRVAWSVPDMNFCQSRRRRCSLSEMAYMAPTAHHPSAEG